MFEHRCRLLRRIGLPERTIAASFDEYIEAAVRLAGNHVERQALYAYLRS